MARLAHAWRQSLVTEVGSISGHSKGNYTHVPYRQMSKARHHRLFLGVDTHQTSDTGMRNCVKSGPWGPHNGVKLTLNINFGSVVSRQLVGKISKRNRHHTNALQGQSTQPTQHIGTKQDATVSSKAKEASLPRWSGGHPSCMFPIRKRSWFPGRGR